MTSPHDTALTARFVVLSPADRNCFDAQFWLLERLMDNLCCSQSLDEPELCVQTVSVCWWKNNKFCRKLTGQLIILRCNNWSWVRLLTHRASRAAYTQERFKTFQRLFFNVLQNLTWNRHTHSTRLTISPAIFCFHDCYGVRVTCPISITRLNCCQNRPMQTTYRITRPHSPLADILTVFQFRHNSDRFDTSQDISHKHKKRRNCLTRSRQRHKQPSRRACMHNYMNVWTAQGCHRRLDCLHSLSAEL